MSEWKTFKGEILGDLEARAVYDARKPAYELASKLISLRKKLGLSQRDLAKAAGLKQPHIARIERGEVSPTWATTSRIFEAVGAELEVIYKGKR